MLKFNNTHIFTGYLKQLLSTFNLPTCKVYTKEFADYLEQHGVEDPRVIESFDTLVYYMDRENNIGKKRIAYQAAYLKNDELYAYFWPFSSDSASLLRKNNYWKRATEIFYDKDTSIPGLTKNLNSPGDRYDVATHEYLGDYLRFLRDYYNVNLMSLYNCFSNNICNNLFYRINRTEKTTGNYTTFDSTDPHYRIYVLPVKLFSNYTIAIDSSQEIEMFCGIYNKNLNASAKFADLAKKTYKKVNRTYFSQPFVYDKLDVKYWSFEQGSASSASGYPNLIAGDAVTRWDIDSFEKDLKLFIKVPVSCRSSIVVLEGDYRNFNDFKYAPIKYINEETGLERVSWEYTQNRTILNFESNLEKLDLLNKGRFVPISKLQLLAFNTGESYPFADRLIEYLSNSAITAADEIADNIKRVQAVMNDNSHYFKIEGLWEDKMQKIIYDYMLNSDPLDMTKASNKGKSTRVRYRGIGYNPKSTLYDVLGYVDREAEKRYASWKLAEDGTLVMKDNIQNIDIYDGIFGS